MIEHKLHNSSKCGGQHVIISADHTADMIKQYIYYTIKANVLTSHLISPMPLVDYHTVNYS